MIIVSVILVCHIMFLNFAFCNMVQTIESYSSHLFGILFEISFYSTMKKRTKVQEIGDRTWVVYSSKSQYYGRKRPVFRPFGSDDITVGRV